MWGTKIMKLPRTPISDQIRYETAATVFDTIQSTCENYELFRSTVNFYPDSQRSEEFLELVRDTHALVNDTLVHLGGIAITPVGSEQSTTILRQWHGPNKIPGHHMWVLSDGAESPRDELLDFSALKQSALDLLRPATPTLRPSS